MRIWLTRTEPDNRTTAVRLADLGHEVLLEPVTRVRAVASELPSRLPDAIVFTSRHGVRHHPRDPELLAAPVFAVGDRTAESARAAGYVDVRSADGDVGDLQQLIAAHLTMPSRILHVAGRDVAGDLTGFLRTFGHLVERLVVYVAQPVALRWLVRIRRRLDSIDGIMVHSPREAERVARLLRGTTWRGTVWCISEACARRLGGLPLARIICASRPNDAAMIELVRRHAILRLPSRHSLRSPAAYTRNGPRPDARPHENDNECIDDGDGSPKPAA